MTINTSNILSFAIPICLLIVALGSALAYFVVRHRRLTNSFTQFANSHYDTRRGQATFPGTTDGLGKSIIHLISGFNLLYYQFITNFLIIFILTRSEEFLKFLLS